MVEHGVGGRRRRPDLRRPGELRELRISRVARVELRAHRICHGVAQGALPDRVLLRIAEFVADGVLSGLDADPRCQAAWRAVAAAMPARRGLGVQRGGNRGSGAAGVEDRVAARAERRYAGDRRAEGCADGRTVHLDCGCGAAGQVVAGGRVGVRAGGGAWSMGARPAACRVGGAPGGWGSLVPGTGITGVARSAADGSGPPGAARLLRHRVESGRASDASGAGEAGGGRGSVEPGSGRAADWADSDDRGAGHGAAAAEHRRGDDFPVAGRRMGVREHRGA